MKYRILLVIGLAQLLAFTSFPDAAQVSETSRVYAEIPDDPLFRVLSDACSW